MKEKIHPKYIEATITCACGEVIHTRSTRAEIKVGVCSKCHPFFTGTQKFVDTAGRVEKFMKKYEKTKKLRRVRKPSAKATPETQVGVASEKQGAPGEAGERTPRETPAQVVSVTESGTAAEKMPEESGAPGPEEEPREKSTAPAEEPDESRKPVSGEKHPEPVEPAPPEEIRKVSSSPPEEKPQSPKS
jgi:large subunit ribosomal protein L31